jgi:DNA-binding transcriptional MerR regulator
MRSSSLPTIPAKRYFTIGEVSELCDVKPHVLRYWEQEFTQLRPVKRRGNRRYYQHHEVMLIRRIRELLYDEGFTITGARSRLGVGVSRSRSIGVHDEPPVNAGSDASGSVVLNAAVGNADLVASQLPIVGIEAKAPKRQPSDRKEGSSSAIDPETRRELQSILRLLKGPGDRR